LEINDLNELLKRGENIRTEFKRSLSKKDLELQRKSKLIAQLKYITDSEYGIFGIGIDDIKDKNWIPYPLDPQKYKESKQILKILCNEANLIIIEEEKIKYENGFIGIFKIDKKPTILEIEQGIIGVNITGRVNAGKSSLVGTLICGQLDDGKGRSRSVMLRHPQELLKGQTSDLHISFLGYDKQGNPINIRNPLNAKEQGEILDKSKKIIIFYDAPGHMEFSKTMFRSVLGASAQYCLLLIPALDEYRLITVEENKSGLKRLDSITREQLLIIAVQQKMPFILLLTMIDMVNEEQLNTVKETIKETLQNIGRILVPIKKEEDIEIIKREINHGVIAPLLEISCITGQNLQLLYKILLNLPPTITQNTYDKPALAYIDKVYKGIPGTNIVVTGSVIQGIFKPGQKVLVMPGSNGEIYEGTIASIEVFKKRVERVKAGEVFGIDIHKIPKEFIRRGMIIADKDINEGKIVKNFKVKIIVSYHSVRIREGYSPVLQSNTIHQSVIIKKIYNKKYLVVGDYAEVELEFIRTPEFLRIGDKIILRERNLRCFGVVTEFI